MGKITDVNGDGRIDAADILAPMRRTSAATTPAGGWADGISEDGDTAHLDDLVGWNFVNNTNNPFDDHGHGTHTAGTIGAMGNNGVGVVGVNWTVQIMPLKFLDSTGSGSDLAAAAAIRYAADHGARVSNNSSGGGSGQPAISDAISYAATKGDVFVAAAGNQRRQHRRHAQLSLGLPQRQHRRRRGDQHRRHTGRLLQLRRDHRRPRRAGRQHLQHAAGQQLRLA